MIYERMRVSSTPSRGGALPTYQRKGELHAPGSGVSARIDDSAARIAGAGGDAEARALAGLGNAVKGAVDVGVKAYDDYSKSKATQLITEYRRSMNEALYGDGGILTKQGEAAIGADRQRADRARQLRDELLKDTNEFTRHYFTTLADDYDADTSLKAQRYADEQHTTMLNRNDEAAANERGEFAIASYKNQQDFDRGAGEGLWHAEQRLRRQGYSGEALARGLKEYTSKVFGGAIQQALANGDIQSAERLLSKGSRIYGEGESAYSRMTAPDIADAKLKIQAKREALQAKAEAQRKKALDREIQTMSNSLVRAVQLLPQEDIAGREHLLVEMAAQIQDPELRDKVLAKATQEISFNRRRFEALQDAVTAEFNTPQVRSMSPEERTARLNQYLDEERITQQTYDVLNKSINGGPTFTWDNAFNDFLGMAIEKRDDGTPWFTTETEFRAAMTEAGTVTLSDQDKIIRAWKETQKAESTTATAKEKAEAEVYKDARDAFLKNLEALGVDGDKTYHARVYFLDRFDEFKAREGRYPTEQEMLSMSAAAIQKIWTGQKRGLGGKVEMSLYEASVQIPAEARRQIRAELLRAGHKPEDITEEMVIQEYHRNDNQAMREASIFNTDSWGYYVE